MMFQVDVKTSAVFYTQVLAIQFTELLWKKSLNLSHCHTIFLTQTRPIISEPYLKSICKGTTMKIHFIYLTLCKMTVTRVILPYYVHFSVDLLIRRNNCFGIRPLSDCWQYASQLFECRHYNIVNTMNLTIGQSTIRVSTVS